MFILLLALEITIRLNKIIRKKISFAILTHIHPFRYKNDRSNWKKSIKRRRRFETNKIPFRYDTSHLGHCGPLTSDIRNKQAFPTFKGILGKLNEKWPHFGRLQILIFVSRVTKNLGGSKDAS